MGAREQRRIVRLSLLIVLAAVLPAAIGAGAAACGEEAASSPPPAATPASGASPDQAAAVQTVPVPAVSYAEPPVSNDSGGGRPFSVGAVGWRFKPTVDVEVTSLGFYDAEQDGLAAAHRVGIFDAKTDDLVARVVVTPGSPLDGAFRWESLDSPAALESGHSYLVAAECARGDALFDPPAGEWAPEIAYDRLCFAADGFAAPHEVNGWLCFGGPNFRLVPASTSSSAQARPASKEVLALLEGRMAAMNRGDGVAAAEYYAPNGVMEETDLDPDLVTRGRAAIGERLQGLVGDTGLRLVSAGTPIQFDRYVAEPVIFDQEGGPGHGAGMLVFEIDADGLIAYQWVIGWVE